MRDEFDNSLHPRYVFQIMIHSNKHLETKTDAYKFEISEKAKNLLGIPDSSQLGEAFFTGTYRIFVREVHLMVKSKAFWPLYGLDQMAKCHKSIKKRFYHQMEH